MSKTSDGQEFNPVTGEIIEPPAEAVATAQEQSLMPPAAATGAELANLPDSLSGLAEFFAEPEPDVRDVIQWIAGAAEMEQADPEDTMRSIMARILSSTTAEQILSAHRVVHAQDVLNVPFEVMGVKWQRSRVDGGSACYAVITAKAVETGEDQTITCSGRNVMTQLLAFSFHKVYPVRCRIAQASKPTERGYYPLWLEPA